MCIYVTNSTKVKETKKRIIAYKVFVKDDDGIISPWQNHKPNPIGEINFKQSVKKFKEQFNLLRDDNTSGCGFHLYTKISDALRCVHIRNGYTDTKKYIAYECEIPKWSAIVTGTEENGKTCYMTSRYIINHQINIKN